MLGFDMKDQILKTTTKFWEKLQIFFEVSMVLLLNFLLCFRSISNINNNKQNIKDFLKFRSFFFCYLQLLLLTKNDSILSIKEV